jgi:hypothetical protein
MENMLKRGKVNELNHTKNDVVEQFNFGAAGPGIRKRQLIFSSSGQG